MNQIKTTKRFRERILDVEKDMAIDICFTVEDIKPEEILVSVTGVDSVTQENLIEYAGSFTLLLGCTITVETGIPIELIIK